MASLVDPPSFLPLLGREEGREGGREGGREFGLPTTTTGASCGGFKIELLVSSGKFSNVEFFTDTFLFAGGFAVLGGSSRLCFFL